MVEDDIDGAEYIFYSIEEGLVKILHNTSELSTLGPAYLAIGVFDGVHLGHKAVIQRAVEDSHHEKGSSVVVTFDPHPLKILRPDIAPHLLTATKHKLSLISELAPSHCLILKFDSAFAAQSAESFIQSLINACNPLREICVGYDWTFGHKRGGNLDLLNHMGSKEGFTTVGIPNVVINKQVASSTLIRNAIESGNLEEAAQFLGRPFSILGTIIGGKKLGKDLGFPTANLAAHNEQFPPNGVYVVKIKYKQKQYRGVANVGIRPTIAGQNPERLVEVYIFDFSQEIYGEDLEVFFIEKLRDEKKFGNLDELKSQIKQDVKKAKAVLNALPN